MMKRLATICARGGSKGIPNKNLKLLGGRPLIAWSVLQAKATGLFDRIVVSSDSDAILSASLQAGADDVIDRPIAMATDEAAKVPAILHALLETERRTGERYDILVDLDATAPLRLPEDIAGAVMLLEKSGSSNVITGNSAYRSPYFDLVELQGDGTVQLSKIPSRPIVRRQDVPVCYDMNASIYVWKRDALVANPSVFYDDTRLFEMPAERSREIDSPFDFSIVEFLFEKLKISDALDLR
jgi:N-acylneuraminate cytidylyltransferase/CMP-N,N'-diacetyllegionaminic acid synthase